MASFGQTLMPPSELHNWLIKFVVNAYGCTSSCNDLTTARIALFKDLIKKKIDTDINRFLPPTDKALIPHVQRAALQTYISRNCCSPPPVLLPDATKFGWKRDESMNMLVPITIAESDIGDSEDSDDEDIRYYIASTEVGSNTASSDEDDDSDSGDDDTDIEQYPYLSTDSDSDN